MEELIKRILLEFKIRDFRLQAKKLDEEIKEAVKELESYDLTENNDLVCKHTIFYELKTNKDDS
jgi:hypothetical protein